jgi:hypothetical protein
VDAVVGVERCNLELGNANLGDDGDEGKEPPSLVGAALWERSVVGDERCNLGM